MQDSESGFLQQAFPESRSGSSGKGGSFRMYVDVMLMLDQEEEEIQDSFEVPFSNEAGSGLGSQVDCYY